ncbi:DUF3617 domain-containing protein [Stutzerimonas xanthomarina]|uniref:DUF3617 domain-containing protein n=1 Tax=Stutzerimonas xanthomarina TaxID=271420 RepID=UPI003AA7DF69
MTRFARLTLVALVAASLPAQAAQLLPGLWEFTSEELVVDGMQMPGMSEMLAQMKELPSEQRKMMESMLAEQGVELGSGGIRICLSEAQVESRKLPFQDEPGCTQEVLEQTDSLWRFRFECPDAKGHGETKVINEREVANTIETSYSVGEQQGTSRMQSRGHWVGEDCGPLPPQN